MRLCRKCGGEMANSHETCGACGAPSDAFATADHSPTLATEAIVAAKLRLQSPQKPVGVPRRFSVGTMMILATAVILLFAVLKTLDTPPAVFAVVTLYVAGIAASQSLLFKGRRPRLASVVSGMSMIALFVVIVAVMEFRSYPRSFDAGAIVGFLFAMVIFPVVFGGPLSYVVGCFVASIFLVRRESDDAMPTSTSDPRKSEISAYVQKMGAKAMDPGPNSGNEMGERPDPSSDPRDDVRPTSRPAEGPILATVVEEPVYPLLDDAAKGPWAAPFGLKPSQPAVSVPRQFSVGTMMILVTAFAVLLGILRSFGVPPEVFATVAAFIAGVGACQVLLFKGQDPRRASFYGGIITMGVLAIVTALVAWFATQSVEYVIASVFWGAVLAVILGGPLGYAAGCLVAAIFLVRKEPSDAESMAEDGS
jgi:hypothetical protein